MLGALLASERRRVIGVALGGTQLAFTAAGVVRVLTAWPEMLDYVESHGDVTGELDDTIARAGGEERLEACGSLHSSFLLTSAVAWTFERHLEEVTDRPRVPGVILRAQLYPGLPVDPSRESLDGVRGRTILARTRHWEVEAVCRGG